MKNVVEQKLESLTTMPSTSTGHDLRSGADWIACATPQEQEEFLKGLEESTLLALPYLFDFWALPHQLPPEGDWRTWVVMGGRGAGKTRAGAEWVRAEVEGSRPLDIGRSRRVALVGETIEQAREVMVFGDSGILACSPPDRRPKWEATRKRLVWPNGAVAQVFSAHEPESLRGPQFDAAWVDELAKWKRAEDAWDMLQFGLRLGPQPRQDVPHAPRLAAAAEPWPGGVAVYSSVGDSGFSLNSVVSNAAILGQTETELHYAPTGLWDKGEALRVRLSGGVLSSATDEEIFAGANAIAIGDGSSEGWEIFQFAVAELVGESTYVLSKRLRGQLGTDSDMRDVWPVGSTVVLLNQNVVQIDLQSDARGLARFYRIGPSGRPVDDPSYQQSHIAFNGVGLRPYRPCHLSLASEANGDISLSWTRRTRIDGDIWLGTDVPLGETSEAFLVRIIDDEEKIHREVTVQENLFHYSLAMQAADGFGSGFQIAVAQISEAYGPGPFASVVVPG